ncbi:MAG TPA: DUF2267 domain-containing protein [Rhizomicrobium sp.]|jgi:uncharacterized protein (DUF2267 family)|nr:DUF2267 domain-containing protein [Rhizomicrobium sp.]
MATHGVDVFDKTLQTTHIWLNELGETIGPDGHVAWHVLSAVLRTLRDRMPLDLAAHLGSQLPLLVRGAYYDQWVPSRQPDRGRSLDDFLHSVSEKISDTRPVNVRDATQAVFHILSRHIDHGQAEKVVHAMPEPVRNLWRGGWTPEPERERSRPETRVGPY